MAASATTITIAVSDILTAMGLIGIISAFSKGKGPRIGHNQYENEQIDSLSKKYNLSKDQRRRLHDMISGQNLTYSEIEQIIIDYFVK